MLAVSRGCGPLNLWHCSGERMERGSTGFLLVKDRWCWWRAGQGDGDSTRSVLARARLSSFFSSRIGFDSRHFQAHDFSQMLWVGPLPGDIAEVEAYCRIFRAAEQLHLVIMEVLCNPETGECAVSYEIPSEEMTLLEEKVVAVLGCMLALLNRAREDVLSGRSSFTSSFQTADVNVVDGKLPPLAMFRGEMKRCCESLHVALANYLAPSGDRNIDIWRRLNRLKNVCYDAGFSRGDGHPCPTLFANWSPVYLSKAKETMALEDSEVAFWRGGQVTDEGLSWLLEKGFKTIVDLREEAVNDEFYQAAIEHAVSLGKIEVVNLPVRVGTVPSVEQVKQFALLVADPKKRPLYLHSQEGVGRPSAMVSRWRQYNTRSSAHLVPHRSPNGKPVNKTVSDEDLNVQSAIPSKLQGSKPDKDTSKLHSCPNSTSLYDELRISSLGNECLDGKVTDKLDSVHKKVLSSSEANGIEVESVSIFTIERLPLHAQFPKCDIFSRKEMARFFKSRKVTPASYLNELQKRVEISPTSIKTSETLIPSDGANVAARLPGSMQRESINWVYRDRNYHLSSNATSSRNVKHLNGENFLPLDDSVNGRDLGGVSSVAVETLTNRNVNNNLNASCLSTKIQDNKANNGNGFANSVAGNLEVVDGNMCASSTGVVRIQSRRKAEMFLVRTDGFSCTREKVNESSLAFTHPSTQQQMLMWKTPPKTVLLLKKLGQELMEEAKEVALFLYHHERMNVLVEPDVHDIFARIPGFGFVQTFYSHDTSDLHERVDFVACLGGDGVILHASNIFRGPVPPVVSFNLGSLGFLTSHTFKDHRHDLRAVIHGNNTLDGVYITLRMRLVCEIFRNGKAVPGKIFHVLNEVVVDRGSNPYLSKIECYEHNRLITKVQGDGVIVATPTGSTAYSTAAGGSMVHPNVPCMLFTPICPHSLSFRPVILPDSASLELKIPDNTRSNAWVSFDGKRRQQLSKGDSVRISMSQHPLPTVNKSDQTGDWFLSLIRCLNWNERLDQKAL